MLYLLLLTRGYGAMQGLILSEGPGANHCVPNCISLVIKQRRIQLQSTVQ